MPRGYGSYGSIGSQQPPRRAVRPQYDQYDYGYDTNSGADGPLRQLVRKHNLNKAYNAMSQSDRNQLADRPESQPYNNRGMGDFTPSGVANTPLSMPMTAGHVPGAPQVDRLYTQPLDGSRPRFMEGRTIPNAAGGFTEITRTPTGGLAFNSQAGQGGLPMTPELQARLAQRSNARTQRQRDIVASRFLANGGSQTAPAARDMLRRNAQYLADVQHDNELREAAASRFMGGAPVGTTGGMTPRQAREFYDSRWGNPQPPARPADQPSGFGLESIGRSIESLTPTILRGSGGLAGAYAGGKMGTAAGMPLAPYTYGAAPVIGGGLGSILGYYFGDSLASSADEQLGISSGINNMIPDSVSGALGPAVGVGALLGGLRYARGRGAGTQRQAGTPAAPFSTPWTSSTGQAMPPVQPTPAPTPAAPAPNPWTTAFTAAPPMTPAPAPVMPSPAPNQVMTPAARARTRTRTTTTTQPPVPMQPVAPTQGAIEAGASAINPMGPGLVPIATGTGVSSLKGPKGTKPKVLNKEETAKAVKRIENVRKNLDTMNPKSLEDGLAMAGLDPKKTVEFLKKDILALRAAELLKQEEAMAKSLAAQTAKPKTSKAKSAKKEAAAPMEPMPDPAEAYGFNPDGTMAQPKATKKRQAKK